jgi:hypothetical protein
MSEAVDFAIVGAGPAGLAAAKVAADCGLEVVLLDEQPTPGGQIWRGVSKSDASLSGVLGAEYALGRARTEIVSDPRISYRPGATVWEVTRSRAIHYSIAGKAHALKAKKVLLATGALERPMPFPGWTLPGVMTAGAGQILLKSSGLVGNGKTVLAGSGPLLYLLAVQYLRAGATIEAIVETTPKGRTTGALRHLPRALKAFSTLREGLALLNEIRRHGVHHYKHASDLTAVGTDRVTALRFCVGPQSHEIETDALLIHTGIVPNVQITRSLELPHQWDDLQQCWRPRLGLWGECELEDIYIAGDGGGIVGAAASEHQGRIAALHGAHGCGALSLVARNQGAARARRSLARHLAPRPFLDALYAPADAFCVPDDATIVCRCEEVSAGDIRDYVELGCLGPDQTKAFGRCGMGPCQGRYCGLSVSHVIAAHRGVRVDEVGYYRIRTPTKPVTLGEIASLAAPSPKA